MYVGRGTTFYQYCPSTYLFRFVGLLALPYEYGVLEILYTITAAHGSISHHTPRSHISCFHSFTLNLTVSTVEEPIDFGEGQFLPFCCYVQYCPMDKRGTEEGCYA